MTKTMKAQANEYIDALRQLVKEYVLFLLIFKKISKAHEKIFI
jgi:hypothetical protein